MQIAIDNIAHLDGCGVSNAMALWHATTPLSRCGVWRLSPDAEEKLTTAVKNGAIGIGELKFHVEAAGPELPRMYNLAAELNVPILVHYQEVPHTPAEGVFSTGWRNFDAVLKAGSDFTPGFLNRHEGKLISGSDCSCTDGKVGGISQAGNPGASRLSGKCGARETPGVLKKTVSPAAFRKFTWENAHKTYKPRA